MPSSEDSATPTVTVPKPPLPPADDAPMTKEEYEIVLASRPVGSTQWESTVDAIKANRGNKYPSDWFARVVCDPATFGN